MTGNDKWPQPEQTFPINSSAPATEKSGPPSDVVSRFVEHVSKTGDPNSFPGLVQTRPSLGAEFDWLTGEIIVPVQRSASGLLIVCPWCSPTTPKFKRGRLCWFGQERVMRFVGWRCAKTHLDAASMREADKRWAGEQKKIRCNNFLRANCNSVQELLRVAESLEPAVLACERFYISFSRDTSGVHSDLARYVRDGRLFIDQALGAGSNHQGPNSISVLFGVLDGVRVLKGNPWLVKKLAVVRAQLASIAHDAHRARFGELSHLDDRQRHALHVIIQEAHKELVRIVRTADEFQRFMTVQNIVRLNSWCSHERSDVYSSGIDVALDGPRLRFGYRVNGNRCTTSVLADDAMFVRLPFIEALRRGDTDKD